MRILALLPLLFFAVLPSCRSTYRMTFSDRGDHVVLAESEDELGTRQRWLIYPGSRHDPRLDVTASRIRREPRIGVKVSTISRKRGASEGVDPWRGVYVEEALRKRPAARAGVTRGDIILSVAGEPVSSQEQFVDLVKQYGVADEELEITLHARRRAGDPIGGRDPIVVRLVPEGVEVRDTSTDSIPLEASVGVQTYTGLQVADVPSDVARRVFDVDHSVVLVTGVVSGSPAYYAGLRTGDRIRSCDGVPVDSVGSIRAAVARRLRRDYPAAPLFDLPATPGASAASRSAEVSFEVTGPLGGFVTEVPVETGIEDQTRFYIPILTNYRSRVNRTSLSFLDFIFQFGFNYRSRVVRSSTREPVETSRFSMLPFGMFEVDHGVRRSEYTLFWFITFETER